MSEEIKLTKEWLLRLNDLIEEARRSETINETNEWLLHISGYIEGTIEILEGNKTSRNKTTKFHAFFIMHQQFYEFCPDIRWIIFRYYSATQNQWSPSGKPGVFCEGG